MTAGYFKQTYYTLHPKLYRVAFAILKNTEDAEDILQDAYCKLWDDRAKLVDIQKPEAYCVTLVKHLCLDFLRSPKAVRNDEAVDDYEYPDYSTNAETELINKETMETIMYHIRRLPEKQQKILDLRVFADCSSEEIERITGESSENVRVLLSRARNTLRNNLKTSIL
jgi:RNA polymerase sigma-70 factor (ECF subfamily)